MSCIHYFSSDFKGDLPSVMGSPFNDVPHDIAKQASQQLQHRLTGGLDWSHDFDATDGGKMFGVLVLRDAEGTLGFLAAFSGMLEGQWIHAGFVPPVFDETARDSFLPEGTAELEYYSYQITAMQGSDEGKALLAERAQVVELRNTASIVLKDKHAARKRQRHVLRAELGDDLSQRDKVLARLAFESQHDKREQRDFNAQWVIRLAMVQEQQDAFDGQINALKKIRAQLSRKLHKKVFSGYMLANRLGEEKPLADFYDQGHPPGGAGDCAGPKLIHYAQQHDLTPVAMAEFWWGAAPAKGVRHHGNYYPACRGKCRPILPFMLGGLEVGMPPNRGVYIDASEPVVVYEDDSLLVVNKPCGLLSVPGKEIVDSVSVRMRSRYPDASELLLVHRLDMATSGLLLVAKNKRVHKALQKQFINRTIEKRYVAILSKELPELKGEIDLPLRVDLDDRPRQLVCYEHGKAAKTNWEVIEQSDGRSRVYFYPVSGRTHQLRVHAAHHAGLNAPIVGDDLYGGSDDRLMLHAERLCFSHPLTGKRINVVAPSPF